MSLHPNALPIDDTTLLFMTTIHGLRIQLDSRDELIGKLRLQIQQQATTIKELLEEARNRS